MDQEQYTAEVLEEFGMEQSRAVATPATASIKLHKGMCPGGVLTQTNAAKNAGFQRRYRSAVGKLVYLVNGTRPDIATAVSEVCRFMANPGEEHWTAVKRIMRYLRNPCKGIQYDGKKGMQLRAHCDADFAGEPDKRRSRTGYVISMAGGPISWKSRLQRMTAKSTAEAEYMAAADATHEVKWARTLLHELGCTQRKPTVILEDNNSCIAWSRDRILNEHNKHIQIRYHIVRDSVEEGATVLHRVDSKDNIADILTKNLGNVAHALMKSSLMADS